MDNIPILIDTEPETSMEHDAEENIETRINTATQNATKSLFNITFENFEEQKEHESVEFKDYETHLQHEIKDWKTVWFNAYQVLKQSKQKHPTVDKTLLPPERRQYLESAPRLQNFIRESVEFRRQAHQFLELDYEELMENFENLEEICEHNLNLVKKQYISKNLAN